MDETNGAAIGGEQIRGDDGIAATGLSEFSTQEMYREIYRRLGEDPARDGLVDTPAAR